MEHYLSLLVRSIFIDNIALSMFLGMCTFIALSKKINETLKFFFHVCHTTLNFLHIDLSNHY